ncbi:MAG: ATP synthase epsilon chain [Syntrophorhabdus sp. PtaU1.Bin050]|nr:MAG: ATP synthase epsilon chain [Syntrophorhabdus sp. PtaU1.Bin050]
MLNLEIVTAEKVLVNEEVDMVEAKGSLGEFGILPGHVQFMALLEIGEVRYVKGGRTSYLATSGGFGEVADDKVTFLLDTAEFAEDIDPERAKIAMEEAQERLKEFEMDTAEYRMYELALLRALARLQVASRKM